MYVFSRHVRNSLTRKPMIPIFPPPCFRRIFCGYVMSIQVSRLSTAKEFCVQSEISTTDVDKYFVDLEDCRALKPLKYDARLMNHGKFIALEADVEVSLELTCHRCGDTFPRDFSMHVSLKLIEASSVGSVEEIVLSEDDLDTVTYQGNDIELNDILLESIYLDLDAQCLCSDDCKGICLNCGTNLNKGTCSCPKV